MSSSAFRTVGPPQQEYRVPKGSGGQQIPETERRKASARDRMRYSFLGIPPTWARTGMPSHSVGTLARTGLFASMTITTIS